MEIGDMNRLSYFCNPDINKMPKYTTTANCLNCKKKNDLFCVLTDEELAEFNDRKYEVVFEPGETIIKEGSPITHIACLSEGLVKLQIEGIDKRKIILRLARSGDILGGPGFLTDNLNHFTATAIEETKVCLVDADIFMHFLENNSSFAMGLIKRINEAFIGQFDNFVNLTQKQIPGRVATTILYLRDVIYKTNPFYLTITRQDMADMSSMTKESLIRALKALKDDEVIEITGNELRIVDLDQLKEISERG
jgi:CRP/FNR family transcriptional regulator